VGTHEDLLELEGRYRALYNTYFHHQTAGEITEETVKKANEELGKTAKLSTLPDV